MKKVRTYTTSIYHVSKLQLMLNEFKKLHFDLGMNAEFKPTSTIHMGYFELYYDDYSLYDKIKAIENSLN